MIDETRTIALLSSPTSAHPRSAERTPPTPAFHEFLGILGPLLGIAFGFDAINGERAQGTLPRLVAQPIHRDEIVNGKFAAGIGAIALALASVIAVVSAYGSIRLGIGPTQGNLVRILAFYRRRRRLHRALAGAVAPPVGD